MPFAYDTCIGCYRTWPPEGRRKGKGWWPVCDKEIQRWCCYLCISSLWRQSAAAARIGPCPPKVVEALQTDAFQFEIRYLLEQHKPDHATEDMHLDCYLPEKHEWDDATEAMDLD